VRVRCRQTVPPTARFTAREARDTMRRRAPGPSVALVALLGTASCLAQEIAPFRITGVDGFFQMTYLRDSNTSTSTGFGESQQLQSSLREELFLNAHGYVYHPGLLSFDIGGGPIFDQSSYGLDGRTTRSDKPLYSFSCQATALRGKPYGGSVFYDHLNPTQSVSPGEILLSQNESYGFNFHLLEPVTPVPLQLDARRSHNTGKSSLQTLDDRIDEIALRLRRNIGRYGDTEMRVQTVRQDSLSGAIGLPILATTSKSDIVEVDTRLRLGARSQYMLDNLITLEQQAFTADTGRIADTRGARFGLNLTGNHSEALQTHARYDFISRDEGSGATTSNTLNGGFTYQAAKGLDASLNARGETNDGPEVSAKLAGLDGLATYRHALPVGELTFTYGVAYSVRDQSARADQAHVVGERIVLTGTTPVPLARPQVLATTVVVSNVDRTQSFAPGTDYVLSVVGLTTRIERVVGGNITDGQELLVDYDYATGGTYAVNELDNSLSVNWGLKNFVNVYARYFDSSPRLASGTPTFELNPATSTIIGTRVDVPLKFISPDWLVGGNAEREDRSETISPYSRSSYEVYVQAPLPLVPSGSIRVGARQATMDYDLSPDQSVDQRSYDVRMWTRLRYGVDLSLEATQDHDTGALTDRKRTFAVARAQWRVRAFLATLEVSSTREEQGPVATNRTAGQFVIRRNF
jgi:hypothetical protein